MLSSRNKNNAERRKALEQKLAKVQRDLRQALKTEKDQDRRDETRRKVIAGALALSRLARNPTSPFGKEMFNLLHEGVPDRDRGLFDFLPPRVVSADAKPISVAVNDALQAAE